MLDFSKDLLGHMNNIKAGPTGPSGPSGGDSRLIAATMAKAKENSEEFNEKHPMKTSGEWPSTEEGITKWLKDLNSREGFDRLPMISLS